MSGIFKGAYKTSIPLQNLLVATETEIYSLVTFAILVETTQG